MTHTQQISEAVAWLKKEKEDCHCHKSGLPLQCSNCDRRDVSICFFQEYLAIRGIPEEREYIAVLSNKKIYETGKLTEGRTVEDWQKYGFNQALHLCRLAHAKNCQECRERVPSVEKKLDIKKNIGGK